MKKYLTTRVMVPQSSVYYKNTFKTFYLIKIWSFSFIIVKGEIYRNILRRFMYVLLLGNVVTYAVFEPLYGSIRYALDD
jgi:hypothetical protein